LQMGCRHTVANCLKGQSFSTITGTDTFSITWPAPDPDRATSTASPSRCRLDRRAG
jgi:hypothetical protein